MSTFRHGHPVLWPLDVMHYGQKEFGVKDCNGYNLAFKEAVEKEDRSKHVLKQ